MFSIFTHVMKPVRDTNSEPASPVPKARLFGNILALDRKKQCSQHH